MSQIKFGLIGGSGLGQALGGEEGERTEINTPFGPPSGPVIHANISDHPVAIIQRHGPGHLHNPTAVPYRANIFALKSLGVTHIIASGATGSLREHIAPRDLVIPDQIIDKTHKRPNTFYEHAAVHVEFAQPFCPVTRNWLINAAQNLPNVKTHTEGTYIAMEGPAFSTIAESNIHRQWGGDLIGMTAMPEAKLAREAEIAYALVALPTDYDCWKPHQGDKFQLLQEIIANVNHATENAIKLIKLALENISHLEQNPSPAHDALALGIWSDKSKIDPAEITRLTPLWSRHFD